MSVDKMKLKITLISLLLLAVLGACENEDQPAPMTLTYTFEDGPEGWSGNFADYPIDQEASYDLHFGYSTLPSPLDESQGALMITGNNHSDDLFMFIKRKITGLSPGRRYTLAFTVEFASNVPDGMVGIGGSPGESVYIKAGASQLEPIKIESADGYYRMNIDKGNQAQGGEDMITIGDFSNDTDLDEYTLVTRTTDIGFPVQADNNGELWIIVGTDSGFEGVTTIFYDRIEVELR